MPGQDGGNLSESKLRSMMANSFTPTGIAAGATRYYNPLFTANSNEAARQMVVPVRINVVGLYVRTNSAQPATSGLTFTLRKNGVDTAITFTVAANAAAGNYGDTQHEVEFLASDKLSIKAVNAAGTTSAQVLSISMGFN